MKEQQRGLEMKGLRERARNEGSTGPNRLDDTGEESLLNLGSGGWGWGTRGLGGRD